MFDHHTCATLRPIDPRSAFSDEQLDAHAPGTFGSVPETLIRFLANEESCLAAVDQAPPPKRDAFTFQGFHDVRTPAEQSGPRLAEMAARADGDPEQRDKWRGGPFAVRTSVFVIQIGNHATEHRAQIATIPGQHGIAPPVLDGWTHAQATGRG